MTELSVLTDLLAAEHAAIYAYGVLGAKLDEPTRELALTSFEAHRARRDELITSVRAAGIEPAGPEPAYDVAVTGRTAALALALRVETELGVRWRDLVAVTDDPRLRKLAVLGLQDSAVRATRWRTAAGTDVATVALPGEA